MATTTDGVSTSTALTENGTAYTTGVSNDKLSNEDFLKLMLQELKLQDPTSPMDSNQMLQTQMQMSTMETNLQMTNAMESLKTSIANMSLTNAMGFMGKKVDAVVDIPITDEQGNPLKDDEGNTLTEKVRASFHIGTVSIDDGVTNLESYELMGFKDNAVDIETGKEIDYDPQTGQIKNSDGTLSEYYIKLDASGMFAVDDAGKIVITDAAGNIKNPTYAYTEEDSGLEVVASKYGYAGTDEIYSPNVTNLKYEEIVKIY